MQQAAVAQLPWCNVCAQEEDVIGLLEGEDISKLKPLSDRVMIKVRQA